MYPVSDQRPRGRSGAHQTHRLAGSHELARANTDLAQSCQEQMIAIAGIEDQELAIGAKRSGKLDMRIRRRHHLGASAGCDEYALGLAAKSVLVAEFAQDLAL